MKNWFFEKRNKFDKPLDKLKKKGNLQKYIILSRISKNNK